MKKFVLCAVVLLTLVVPKLSSARPTFIRDLFNQRARDFDKYKRFEFKDGIQCDDRGWIIRVDRGRSFDRLDIHNPISAARWPSGDLAEEDKEDKGLYPFERARVNALVFYGDDIRSRMSSEESLETVAFRGIKDLNTIVFRGSIPRITEESHLFGLIKDDDWRENLRQVTFEDSVDGIETIPFLRDVKCLALGTNTLSGVLRWGRHGHWPLEKCRALRQLIVPYEMATNVTIRWGEILRHSPLKDSEVLAYEPALDDSDQRHVVLLNAAKNGEISDTVTTIRADAIADKFVGRNLYLPVKLREIIGGRLPETRPTMKRDTLLFYPDLFDSRMVSKLARKKSFMEDCPVSVTTAYRGLKLRTSLGRECSDFSQSGYAQKGVLSLCRGRGLKNEIFATLTLQGQEYPLYFCSSNGRTSQSLSVTFVHPVTRKGRVGRRIAVMIVVFVLVAAGLALATWKKKLSLKRAIGVFLGFLLGGMVFFWSMDEIGVPQYVVDRYLTGTVMSYLDSSFISSLYVLVSTSLVKLVLGLLQGLNFSVLLVSFDVNTVLEPVQQVLDTISTYSWISTSVLAFVRIACQIISDFSWFVWEGIGLLIMGYSFTYLGEGGKCRRYLGFALFLCFFLTLGLPLVLSACAWFSSEMSNLAGSAFKTAMEDFGALADSFSFEALHSMAAVEELLAQFREAVSNLLSASMYYLATKIFDCFLMPLSLYWVFKRVLKGFSDNKDAELTRIRKLLSQQQKEKGGQSAEVIIDGGNAQ